MLQDLSTYGCHLDENVKIGKKCAKTMKKIAQWKQKSNAIYEQNKDKIQDQMDEIVSYVEKASEIARNRAKNFTTPLIF